VTEHYGLALSPVFVVDRRTIFHCNRVHEILSLD
jgi:hypothetical protein